MITEIAFCGYPVTDIARSRRFYEEVLGLHPTHEGLEGNWIEYDIGSGTLAIGKAPDWNPSSSGASVALEVDDFDATIGQLKAAGIPFVFEPLETPVCHMAIISDPDNSPIIIHKRKAL